MIIIIIMNFASILVLSFSRAPRVFGGRQSNVFMMSSARQRHLIKNRPSMATVFIHVRRLLKQLLQLLVLLTFTLSFVLCCRLSSTPLPTSSPTIGVEGGNADVFRLLSRNFPIRFAASASPISVFSTASTTTTGPQRRRRFITFGVLRTNFWALDSPHILAGMLATIKKLNEEKTKKAIVFWGDGADEDIMVNNNTTGTYALTVGELHFRLNVTTIPCNTYEACTRLSPALEDAYVKPFIANIPNFAAILRPNFILSSRIIDAAKAAGNVPVIGPESSRTSDYTDQTPHVVNFNQQSKGQFEHLFTVMMHNGHCAHSAIIARGHQQPGEIGDSARQTIAHIQRLFVVGMKSKPSVLNMDDATDAELEHFVIHEDLDRACFVLLLDYYAFKNMIGRLSRMPAFDPNRYEFYGGTTAFSDYVQVNNSVASFGTNVFFVHWVPPAVVERFADAFHVWLNESRSSSAFQPSGDSNWTSVATAVAGVNQESEAINFNAFHPDEIVPYEMTQSVAAGHIILLQAAEAARSALLYVSGTIAWPAANASVYPTSHSLIVDFFYQEAFVVGDTPFWRLVRQCPPKPLAQLCFCNTAARVSYLYQLNTTSALNRGRSHAVFDDVAEGQRDVTSLEFLSTCTYESSSWSYPITMLFLLPKVIPPPARQSVQIVTQTLRVAAYEHNFAASRPPRPTRMEFFSVPTGTTTQEALDINLREVDPFIVFGSLQGIVAKTGTVLTIFPNLLTAEEEDPRLVPHDQWSWTNLRLQPSQADYIHSLVSYYKDNTKHFTALRIIASTQREAELIALSFGTFGIRVRVGVEIVVSEDPQRWFELISVWAGRETIPLSESSSDVETSNGPLGPAVGHVYTYGHDSEGVGGVTQVSTTTTTTAGLPHSDHGDNESHTESPHVDNWPFILASSRLDTAQILSRAAAHFVQFERGTLAVATNILSATSVPKFPNKTASTPISFVGVGSAQLVGRDADIIYGTFRREWWTDAAVASASPALREYATDPRYHIGMLGLQLVDALAASVSYDYASSAADILYKLSVVTAAETVFGPFYNATCTADQIARNDRDRICQCVKGVRTIFIHSSRDMYERRQSLRTGRYAYTMTTCGLVYKVYVPPTPSFVLISGRSAGDLSSGATAGIVIGIVVFSTLIVSALVFLACCYGRRNNRCAPKDPSLPFAIAFTDIQSSTALWARAPFAMSLAVEQHHNILRRALRSNDGYEVKTVGDSFMVAFKSVDDAVAFAIDAQILLYSSSEWSQEINAIYGELLMEAEAERHEENSVLGGERDAFNCDDAGEDYMYDDTTHHSSVVLLRRGDETVVSDRGGGGRRHQQASYHYHNNGGVAVSPATSTLMTYVDSVTGPSDASRLLLESSFHAKAKGIGGGVGKTVQAPHVAYAGTTPASQQVFDHELSPFVGVSSFPRSTVNVANSTPTKGVEQPPHTQHGQGEGNELLLLPNQIIDSSTMYHRDNEDRAASTVQPRHGTPTPSSNKSPAYFVDEVAHHAGGGGGAERSKVTNNSMVLLSASVAKIDMTLTPPAPPAAQQLTTTTNGAVTAVATGPRSRSGTTRSLRNSLRAEAGGISGATQLLSKSQQQDQQHHNQGLLLSPRSYSASLVGRVSAHAVHTTNNNVPTTGTSSVGAAAQQNALALSLKASASIFSNTTTTQSVFDYNGNDNVAIDVVAHRPSPLGNKAIIAHSDRDHFHQKSQNIKSPKEEEGVNNYYHDTIKRKINTNNNNNSNNNNSAMVTAVKDRHAHLIDKNHWNGVRVRIGISFGNGEIRRDSVTQGYDYYGTVVNTAARVEGVGHGGQILVTEDVINALSDTFITLRTAPAAAVVQFLPTQKHQLLLAKKQQPSTNHQIEVGDHVYSSHSNADETLEEMGTHYGGVRDDDKKKKSESKTATSSSSSGIFGIEKRSKTKQIVITALGPQPLRGLDESIRLFQLVPLTLCARVFPPLRLHVEKHTEDEDDLTTLENTTTIASQSRTATAETSNNSLRPPPATTDDAVTAEYSHSQSLEPADHRQQHPLKEQQSPQQPLTDSANSNTPEAMIEKLCQQKKYSGRLSPQFVRILFHSVKTLFGPTPDSFNKSAMRKLGEAWGLGDVAAKTIGSGATKATSGPTGTDKFLVILAAKLGKTVISAKKLKGVGVAINSDSALGIATSNRHRIQRENEVATREQQQQKRRGSIRVVDGGQAEDGEMFV